MYDYHVTLKTNEHEYLRVTVCIVCCCFHSHIIYPCGIAWYINFNNASPIVVGRVGTGYSNDYIMHLLLGLSSFRGTDMST